MGERDNNKIFQLLDIMTYKVYTSLIYKIYNNVDIEFDRYPVLLR